MAFRPLQWLFTPPPTIPDIPLPPVPAPSPAAVNSRAAKLIARFDGLNATAKYLEQVIVERTGSLGIQLNLKNDPELSMALQRLYGTDPPPAISVRMYNYLLDAEAGVQRAEIVIEETGASVHVDPVQKADLQKVNSTFEDALLESGTLDSALPLLLRPLKGDRIIYDNLNQGLKEYPILQGLQSGNISQAMVDVSTDIQLDPVTGIPMVYQPPAHAADIQVFDLGSDNKNSAQVTQISQALSQTQAGTGSQQDPNGGDINPDTATNLNERQDAWTTYYAGTMDLVGKVDGAYNDLSQFANTYLYRPLQELQRILQLLAILKLFFHKPKLKSLKATMAAFILPRLASEIGKYAMQIDQNANTITAPVRNLVSSLGRLFGEIQKVGTDVAYLAVEGGLTGMVRNSISGKYTMPPPKKIKALDTIPAGLAKLGSTLSWGMMEMVKQQNYIESSLMKCLDSKLGSTGDQLEVMQALSSIDALTNITKGFLSNGFASVGGSSGTGPGAIQKVQNNVDKFISTNSPPIPQITPPPPQVKAVLASAKTP